MRGPGYWDGSCSSHHGWTSGGTSMSGEDIQVRDTSNPSRSGFSYDESPKRKPKKEKKKTEEELRLEERNDLDEKIRRRSQQLTDLQNELQELVEKRESFDK